MLCQSNCSDEGELVCLPCERLFCLRHGKEHQRITSHKIQLSDDDMIRSINQKKLNKDLKIEKLRAIHQITLNTSLMISNLHKVSQMQINFLKEAKNIS